MQNVSGRVTEGVPTLPLVTFEPADRKCTENWRKTSRPSFGHEHFESDGNAWLLLVGFGEGGARLFRTEGLLRPKFCGVILETRGLFQRVSFSKVRHNANLWELTKLSFDSLTCF